MKSVVVYDSAFGNTAKVGEAISESLQEFGTSEALQLKEASREHLNDVDLIIIGSPTQAGKPTQATEQFIKDLPKELLGRVKTAVFDTRFDVKVQKRALRMLMRTIGYAAPKMFTAIKHQGGKVLSEPIGFIVIGKEGPLRAGELERASSWAKQLVKA